MKQIVESIDVKKRSKIAAVVLASGQSTRFGQPKLGLNIGGRTILHRVIENAFGSAVSQIIVVYSNNSVLQIDEIAGMAKLKKKRVKFIENNHQDRGLSYSMRIGLRAVAKGTDAAIFMMGDQPFISSNVIDHLISEYLRTRAVITAPYYHGERGTPVLFDHVLFNQLKQVQGDVGGRDIINKYSDKVLPVTIENQNAELDIDTLEDYHRACDVYAGKVSGQNNR